MLKQLLINNKKSTILALILLSMLTVGILSFQKILTKPSQAETLEEIDLIFDPEGPYALLFPRRDGNAINFQLKRIASYDAFAYELSYSDKEGIPRGVGDQNTWINFDTKDGEFEQEILFGTCSKNVCKYDEGVENGTLFLKIKKGAKIYKTTSFWHLQKPDQALGNLTSGDGHFNFKTDHTANDLSLAGFTISHEITGAPKLPPGTEVVGKVYSINTPIAKSLPKGVVLIEFAENPLVGSKISRYDEAKNSWQEYETKIVDGKLAAEVDSGGIIAVLAPEKE